MDEAAGRDNAGWACDEMIVEPVARAIYCAARPDLAATWERECDEVRLHYFNLASAAILAMPRIGSAKRGSR